MVKEKKIFGILSSIIIALFFLMPFASAILTISSPNSNYNLGTDFIVEVQTADFQEGYLDVDLACMNPDLQLKNLYHGILNEKIIQITRKLIPTYIGTLKGNCYIEARYGTDIQKSSNFYISDKAVVKLEFGDMSYLAGDKVVIRGIVTKQDSTFFDDYLKGYVEAKINEETKATGLVTKGNFQLNFTVAEKTPGGNYPLKVQTYFMNSEGTVLDTGEAEVNLLITQLPSFIEIVLDNQVLNPEEELSLILTLYDKSNAEIKGEDLTIRIFDSKNKSIFEKIIQSGEAFQYLIPANYNPGFSRISVEKEGIKQEKLFEVKEKDKISAHISNGTLFIKNIGNTNYLGAIEIAIGEKSFVKNVYMKREETKKFDLNAPEGDYEVIIKGGQGVVIQGSQFLTGKAVSIYERGTITGWFVKYPLIWMILIAVLIAIIIVLYKKTRRRIRYTHSLDEREEELKGKIPKKLEDYKVHMPIEKAEHVLVLNGTRQQSGVICLKIKNPLGKTAKQTLNQALEEVKNMKGVISYKEDEIFLIFAPAVTRTTKNTEITIKVARRIDEIFKEHNKKFKETIDYGMGINSGNIIGKTENGVFKFSSGGSVFHTARKIATHAKNEVLIGRDSKNKVLSSVKMTADSEKSLKSGTAAYKIKRIIDKDNESNKDFIREFMRRNEK